MLTGFHEERASVVGAKRGFGGDAANRNRRLWWARVRRLKAPIDSGEGDVKGLRRAGDRKAASERGHRRHDHGELLAGWKKNDAAISSGVIGGQGLRFRGQIIGHGRNRGRSRWGDDRVMAEPDPSEEEGEGERKKGGALRRERAETAAKQVDGEDAEEGREEELFNGR